MPGQSSVALFHRHAPVKVAGDATVAQSVAVVQPFLGDRGGQDRPVGLAVDPFVQIVLQRGLAQVKVLGFADFQIGGPRDRAARLDQVGRVKLLGAVLALIATSLVVAAVRAGALDIAIRKEATIGDRIDLLFGDFLDQSVFRQLARKMLGQRAVLRRRRSPEMVERQAKAVATGLSEPATSRRSIRRQACRPWWRPVLPGCRVHPLRR